MSRDRLRLESNERLDLGDLSHLQLAAHLAIRYAIRGLLYSSDTAGRAATEAWTISTLGSEVTVNAGGAFAGETLADGSIENGHMIGTDGDASQVLDFTGQPSGDYFIYVRADFSAGQAGSRVFWNGTTETEDVAAIDTREVSGWKATFASASPGTNFVQVAKVTWNGAAFTASSQAGEYLFEGNLDDAGTEAAAAWGDGANDRDTDRAAYGATSLSMWMALIRRQITDIIGDTHQGATVPADLTEARAHIDTTTDPHSDSPTWTGIVTIDSGGELEINGTLDVNTALVTFSAGATFGSTVTINDSDPFAWTARRARWAVGGYGLRPYVDDSSKWGFAGTDDGNTNARAICTDTTGDDIYIPITLPTGADDGTAIELTELTLHTYWSGSTSGGAAEVVAALMVSVPTGFGSTTTKLAEATVTESGAWTYPRLETDNDVFSYIPTGDTGRQYWVHVSVDTDGTASVIGITHIELDYEYTAPVS